MEWSAARLTHVRLDVEVPFILMFFQYGHIATDLATQSTQTLLGVCLDALMHGAYVVLQGVFGPQHFPTDLAWNWLRLSFSARRQIVQ